MSVAPPHNPALSSSAAFWRSPWWAGGTGHVRGCQLAICTAFSTNSASNSASSSHGSQLSISTPDSNSHLSRDLPQRDCFAKPFQHVALHARNGTFSALLAPSDDLLVRLRNRRMPAEDPRPAFFPESL